MALKMSINMIVVLLIVNKLCLLSNAAYLAGNNDTYDSTFINENISNASRIVINFDLPDEANPNQKTNETHPNETDILNFILNRSETLSAAESDTFETTTTQSTPLTLKSATTLSSSTTTSDTPTASTTEMPTTTSNPQQLLIPPASINASIAQIANNGFKHKQGQIIIR